MTQEAVDYSFRPPTVTSLVEAGKVAAGRYVGAGTEDKQIHGPERDVLFAAGLAIWLSVEGAADGILQGAPRGIKDANLAVADAHALAVPAGVAMYANCDTDATASQWPIVAAYMRAYSPIVRAAGYRVGLYGGLRAMLWGQRDGLAEFYWQTYAWSGKPTAWASGVAIQQYQNGVPMGGGDVDLNRVMVADYGQWTKGGIAPIQPARGEVMFGGQEEGTSGVALSNGINRRGGFTWNEFCHMVDQGLVQRPLVGPVSTGPYGAYVVIVPKGRMDFVMGPEVATVQPGAGVTAAQVRDIARDEIGRSSNTPGT